MAGGARKAYACLDEPMADAEAARCRLEEQQPQFGDTIGVFDQEHRADRLGVFFRDPTAFPPRIEIADEPRRDLRDERLETHVKAILRGVDRAVPRSDPTDVARPGGPQDTRLLPRRSWGEQLFDAAHRRDQP